MKHIVIGAGRSVRAKYELPDVIMIPGKPHMLEYRWSYMAGMGPEYWQLQKWAREKKARIRKIAVLPRSLRGKRDLRGMPYQPGEWIFCSIPQKELYQAHLQPDRSFIYSKSDLTASGNTSQQPK